MSEKHGTVPDDHNSPYDPKLIVDMKSIQPFSTRDEYIYAMKEDLAEWFNSMYSTAITAHNFTDQLKNGVLICMHANNVMKEGAAKSFKFNISDLNAVGIINTAGLVKGIATSNTKMFTTPSGKSAFAGDYLLYNPEPKAQLYRAYDNVTNFIKWCRFIVKVRECLMFETEDLILCKNEKNFILCLLEVARFGSKFGICVPTIIQLEQEIEAEIALETQKMIESQKINEINSKILPEEFKDEDIYDDLSTKQIIEDSISSTNYHVEKKETLTIENNVIEENYTKDIPVPVSYEEKSTKGIPNIAVNCEENSSKEVPIVPVSYEENRTEDIPPVGVSYEENSPKDIFPVAPEIKEEIEDEEIIATGYVETNTVIENDSLNKSENSFMEGFVPIDNLSNKSISNSNWSQTSSSGCQNEFEDDNKNEQTKDQENILERIQNENEDSSSRDLSHDSYVNDSLEDQDDEEVNKYNESNNTNNSSFLNVDISNRPDRSELNSINNTITAVTLLNNNHNNNILNNVQTSVEITSSLTSFSSLSSSEAINSTSNANSNSRKDQVSCSTTSPSSTASSSPCKFQLSSSSSNSLKTSNNGSQQKTNIEGINVDCNFDFITTSTTFSMSSPVYLSSPSSLESTPTSNADPISAKDEIEQELTKEINELKNSRVPIKLNKSLSAKENNQMISKPALSTKSSIPVMNRNVFKTPNQSNQQQIVPELNSKYSQSKIARSLFDHNKQALKSANTSLIDERESQESLESVGRPSLPAQSQVTGQNKDLHNHVCKIANKCTCEKKFLVDKIGEGKYKIGNTKNVVFIRILRNHIMVRVGGGWDTLENYLNKHDPCRCAPEFSFSKKFTGHQSSVENHTHNSEQSSCQNSSKNIILTPVKPNNLTSSNSHQPSISIANSANLTANRHTPNKPGIDFTNAHLIIERNNQGRHQVGKVILKSNSQLIDDKKANLNETCEEMTGIKNMSINFHSAAKHNQTPSAKYTSNANNISINNSMQSNSFVQNSILTQNNNTTNHAKLQSSSTPHKSESLLKNKMKKLINKIPLHNNSEVSSDHGSAAPSPMGSPINSVRQKHAQKMVEPVSNPIYNSTNYNNNNSTSFYNNVILQANIAKPNTGLLKFTRTNSTEPSTTGYSSLNEDSDHTPSVSVYTETKLPPRILRKYQKRAITESILNKPDNETSEITDDISSKCNDTTHSGTCSATNSGIFSGSELGSPSDRNETSILIENIEVESFIEVKKEEPTEEASETPTVSKTLEISIESTHLSLRSSSNSPPPPTLFTTANKSPKPPPRIKKKYTKKSQTIDLAKYFLPNRKLSDADSLENDSIEENPVAESPKIVELGSKTPEKMKLLNKNSLMPQDSLDVEAKMNKMITDLNDSLEIINSKIEMITKDAEISQLVELDHEELNLEEDTLVNMQIKQKSERTNRAKWDKSNIHSSNEIANMNKRAQWDKTQKELDQMYFNFTKMREKQAQEKADRINNYLNQTKSSSRSTSSKPFTSNRTESKPASAHQSNKKTRNLNLAKERLYEMKLNLDTIGTTSTPKAKKSYLPAPSTPTQSNKQQNLVNPVISNIQNSTLNNRTTPRKVKKRSGERSFTTNIFQDQRGRSIDPSVYTQTLDQRTTLNRTPLRNYSPFITHKTKTLIPKTNLSSRSKNSSSLHNLSHILDDTRDSNDTFYSPRARTDSYASSTSNGTFSSYGQPSEYKETKASELRKKTALMNKIITKNQQFDPIYSRSHPVSSEINNDAPINSAVNTSIGSYEQVAAARKRLFTKKSERNVNYDPNMSICSNGSSTSSATTNSSIPTTTSSYGGNQRQSRQVRVKTNFIQSNIDAISNKKGIKSPIKNPPRSKSSNDFYYDLERTNSEQDLFELLNSEDAPRGDLNQYRIMMAETQKLEQHISKLKTSKSKKPMTLKSKKPLQSGFVNEQNLNKTLNDGIKLLESHCLKNKSMSSAHKRSRSLPQYNIPDDDSENSPEQ